MSKVRKSDDATAADAQHLPQHLQWRACFLKRLAEDDVVEGLIGEIGEGFFDVALINGHAFGDSPLDSRTRKLDAERVHILVLREPGQKLAFSAAQVEHARPANHDLTDDRVIAAAQQCAYKRLCARMHGCRHQPLILRVLARKPRTSSVCSATVTRKASCP